MKTRRIALAALMTIAAAGPAAAQWDDGPRRDRPAAGRPGRPEGGDRREEVQRRIETIRAWRLTEVLDLTPDEAARLAPLDRRYFAATRDLVGGADEGTDRLRRALDGGATDAEIERAVADLQADQDRRLAEFRSARDAVRAALPPRKYARYLVFNAEFAQEIRRLVQEARGGGPGGPGRGPGGGPMGQGGPGGGPPPPPPDDGGW